MITAGGLSEKTRTVVSATTRATDLLGVEDRGQIASGKLADLIAVPGNPLEDVRALEDVRFVMLGGKVVVEP